MSKLQYTVVLKTCRTRKTTWKQNLP